MERAKESAGSGSFVTIERKWKTGDILEVKLPFSLRLESMPDDSSRVAVCMVPLYWREISTAD
jgi:DUF1680 family protein